MRKNAAAVAIAAAIIAAGVWVSAGASGKDVFGAKCASCHGKDGKGNPGMAKIFKVDAAELDLSSKATQDKSDADLAGIISKGEGKMPAFAGKLTDEEIKSVASAVRELGGAPAASAPAAAPAAAAPAASAPSANAASLFGAKCASCHGKDGKGNPAMAGVFKVDPAALDLVDAATLAKSDADLDKVTADGVNKMPAYKDKLKASEIADLTAYFRSLGSK